MVLVKVHFQDFLCKSLFCKMYLYEDRAENRRGPSKAPKDDKYIIKLYKDWGRSCKRQSPPKSTNVNTYIHT